MIVGTAVIALCMIASLWRLRWAFAPTRLDIGSIVEHIVSHGTPSEMAALATKLNQVGRPGAWEHGLASALLATGEERRALLSEQQLELDALLDSWGRVPRVCASIAASTGFLMATLVLRDALASASTENGPPLGFEDAVTQAINAIALGICGGVVGMSVQRVARKGVDKSRSSADRLVDIDI